MTGGQYKLQCNIWFALFVRELQIRAANSGFGYFWIVSEPALHVAVLAAVFGQHLSGVAGGVPFMPFALLGVLGYRVFRMVVERMMTVMDAYASVMTYPQVLPVDLLIVRFFYETMVTLALIFIFGFASWVRYPDTVTFPNPWLFISGLYLLYIFSFGIGVLSFVAKQLLPVPAKFIPAVTRDLYFISGVFFYLGGVPKWVADILWWNPLLHAIDMLREGSLKGFSSPTSLSYLALCSLVSLLLAVCVYFVTRHKVSGRV
jgi:capsular polysaccharide transport system permease protein